MAVGLRVRFREALVRAGFTDPVLGRLLNQSRRRQRYWNLVSFPALQRLLITVCRIVYHRWIELGKPDLTQPGLRRGVFLQRALTLVTATLRGDLAWRRRERTRRQIAARAYRYRVAAQTGHNVVISDVSEDLLAQSKKRLEKSLQRVVKKQFAEKQQEGEKFYEETMGRLSLQTDSVAAVKEADLVIEAIVENIDVKQKLFSALDEAAPQHTIFTSNTSSLSIHEIAVSTKRMDRFGGLHFFNPVAVMKLVEVVRIGETSEETIKTLLDFGKAVGKVTAECKDTPGFIVNRLLVPYMLQAIKMYERGDASVKDIDTCMKLGANMPMGPIELADYTGLDTLKFVMDEWEQKFPGHPLFEQSELLRKMVAEGKFGVKSGEGFYKYGQK